MARVLRPGFAFAVVCDRGFVVGLHTHRDKLMGYLIWLSRDTYDQMPTVDDARGVTDWRWCVFYPLGSAINRDVDIPIGQIDIPTRLESFPRMRAGGGPQPWYQYDGGAAVHPPSGRSGRILVGSRSAGFVRVGESYVHCLREGEWHCDQFGSVKQL